MGFKPSSREYWLKVAGYKCQYEYYDEKRGWVKCDRRADHVHHIAPEGWLLEQGDDPEFTYGLPLCKFHHENYQDQTMEPEEHSRNFSFHPDMGKAFADYKAYKERVLALGKRHAGPSPFQEEVTEHRKKAKQGERYWAGTPEIDSYYTQKMRDQATRYGALTGEKPSDRKGHPYTNKARKRHWWDDFFG